MMTIRYVGLVFCLSTVFLIAGCNGSSVSGPSDSPLPSSPLNKNSASESAVTAIVAVKPKAAATINQIIADQNATGNCYLRIRLIPGGCQGFMHKLDIDTAVTFEDYVFESGGVKVAVFKRQIEMLRGAEVDYVVGNDKQGFNINNPNFVGENAKKSLALLENEKDIK